MPQGGSENQKEHTPMELPKTHKIVKVVNKVSTIRNLTKEEIQNAVKIEEVPLPVPRSGEVLVKVERAAINPMDMSMLKGRDPLFIEQNKKKKTIKSQHKTKRTHNRLNFFAYKKKGRYGDKNKESENVGLGSEGCGVVVAYGGGKFASIHQKIIVLEPSTSCFFFDL